MEVYRQMKRDGVPFNYDERGANWTNFIVGKTKPKDPVVYVYFAELFGMSVDQIILLYSEINAFVLPSVKMEDLMGKTTSPGRPSSNTDSVVKTGKKKDNPFTKSNW